MGNIIWIASYPKSGNTWMRVFIENYLQNADHAVDINQLHEVSVAESKSIYYNKYLPEDRNTTHLSTSEICALRTLVHQDIASQTNTSVFVKTHNFFGDFEGHALHNMAVSYGAIYIVRNPLDVCVSMSKYFGYSIDQAIEYMAEELMGTPNELENVPQIVTSWSLHVKSWTQTPNPYCLVLRYEDMLEKPSKVFRKVEKFIGAKKDPARLKKAIKNASFTQLKSQEKKRGFVEKHENASTFFNQGRKNQWREVLSEAQIQKIIDIHRDQMVKYNYIPNNNQI